MLVLLHSLNAFGAEGGTLHGAITDPLGAVVTSATVELLHGTTVLETARTNAQGTYTFHLPGAGRYAIQAGALTFQTTQSSGVFVSSGGDAELNLTLATQTLTEQVTVTATGTPTPEAQVGAPVTVLRAGQYQYSNQVLDPLRLFPGLQVNQSGPTGGVTSLFIRGANDNANKVLVDGVPADDIGGAVNFTNIDTVGFEKIEVLREPDSALYGSDALAGVVSLTTTRGNTPFPLLTYSGDGGNFNTFRQVGSLSGAFHHFDYFSAFGRTDTRNNYPRNAFHNGTYSGNFGWTPNTANDLRFTLRHVTVAADQPNAILLYGIPDAASVREQDDYYTAGWNNQTTEKWHNQIRYGGLRLNYNYSDFAATGIYDPDLDVYLGAPVTLKGNNGYQVSGQAIFQYGASYLVTYPNNYVAPSKRDFVYAQTDYRVSPHIIALGAFKYEAERGSTLSSGGSPTSISRGNFSYTVQLEGDIRNRLYYTIGSGLEDNGLFGFAATPRASLAYYLFRPGHGSLSGTKLNFSFGKGIKEPSIYNQSISLYDILAGQPNGSELIQQYHVAPIGPETSRTYDGGVDQQFWNGRARATVTYFHNQFTNGVEFVPQTALLQLGLPVASDPAVQYGAAVNSQAFRTQGAELATEFRLSSHLFARGGYTYLDGKVQQSFASDSQPTTFNPNFPNIPIGAFSPLVGSRPFRRAPHSGYFGLIYNQSKWYGSFTGTLVGQRDDSDFLTDSEFGNTLLLPNRNLDGAYQRLDLGGGYQLTRAVNVYTNMQNLLSQHYSEAFGYPALPFTVRAGIKISLGGESWRWR